MKVFSLISRYFLFLSLMLAFASTFFAASAQSSKVKAAYPMVDVSSLIAKNASTVLASNTPTYSITITVTDIRSREGVIRFKFYDNSTSFPHDTGFLRIVVPKSDFEGNSFTVTYTGFVSKNMAIALGDDENNNVELDMGWFFPKEGHAFSDYYHTALRRPVYEDFDFFLSGDKQVTMKMRYY